MDFKSENMVTWERKKAVYLMEVAEDLGMDTSSYGTLAVNPNSGYTYLWLEDYNFTLYMEINCKLCRDDVWVSIYNFDNGDEAETELGNMDMEEIQEWIEETRKEWEDGE